MNMFLLLIMMTFASEQKENDAENLILVKIEEDEFTKMHKTSQYIGVYYIKGRAASWRASRRSKNEKKMLSNGCYKDEETAAHASDTLARKLMKNGEQNHKLNFADDNTEVNAAGKASEYIGVSYCESNAKWQAQRWSKYEKTNVYNGCNYKDEETAAHASDTLARKLMKNGEQNHKLNFPDDDTEVYPEEGTTSSIYIGVSYNKRDKLWIAYRHGKCEKKLFYNGTYKDEETAAHGSDTLARKLMKNGEDNHKLNFPDDDTEVYPEEETTSSIYIGVTYNKRKKSWRAQRWSKDEKTNVYNGLYKDEETAAHASDTLAKKLMENGEQKIKLNFPDDDTERQTNKRKRSENEGHSHNNEN